MFVVFGLKTDLMLERRSVPPAERAGKLLLCGGKRLRVSLSAEVVPQDREAPALSLLSYITPLLSLLFPLLSLHSFHLSLSTSLLSYLYFSSVLLLLHFFSSLLFFLSFHLFLFPFLFFTSTLSSSFTLFLTFQ